MQYLTPAMFDTNATLKIIMIVGIAVAVLLMLAFRSASRQADRGLSKTGFQADHRGRASANKSAPRHRHGSN